MTDAPAPSLLDRIKAAMGTYAPEWRQEDGYSNDDYVAPFDPGYFVVAGGVGERCRDWEDAAARALDLNARAVIDAITGALTWEPGDDENHTDCWFGIAHVATVVRGRNDFAALYSSDTESRAYLTELEARAAVEQAFKAALLPDQPKEKQA